VSFTGTISNDTGGSLPLLGIALYPPDGYSDANFSIRFSDAFNTALADNLYTISTSGYQGSLFDVTVSPNAPDASQLFGTFELSVDAPGTPITIVAPFSVNVNSSTVPAPGSIWVLTGGLAFPLIYARRRTRH